MTRLFLLVAIAALFSLSPTPSAIPQDVAIGGQCFGMRPMCPIGLRPACICYDAFGNNCSWQCVR